MNINLFYQTLCVLPMPGVFQFAWTVRIVLFLTVLKECCSLKIRIYTLTHTDTHLEKIVLKVDVIVYEKTQMKYLKLDWNAAMSTFQKCYVFLNCYCLKTETFRFGSEIRFTYIFLLLQQNLYCISATD